MTPEQIAIHVDQGQDQDQERVLIRSVTGQAKKGSATKV